MRRIFLILFLGLCSCAHSDDWTRRDTVMQLGVTVVLAGDAYTTAQIHKTPFVFERGYLARPLIGSQPSSEDTYLLFATFALTSYLITRALPGRWRPYYQSAIILRAIYVIQNNCDDVSC